MSAAQAHLNTTSFILPLRTNGVLNLQDNYGSEQFYPEELALTPRVSEFSSQDSHGSEESYPEELALTPQVSEDFEIAGQMMEWAQSLGERGTAFLCGSQKLGMDNAPTEQVTAPGSTDVDTDMNEPMESEASSTTGVFGTESTDQPSSPSVAGRDSSSKFKASDAFLQMQFKNATAADWNLLERNDLHWCSLKTKHDAKEEERKAKMAADRTAMKERKAKKTADKAAATKENERVIMSWRIEQYHQSVKAAEAKAAKVAEAEAAKAAKAVEVQAKRAKAKAAKAAKAADAKAKRAEAKAKEIVNKAAAARNDLTAEVEKTQRQSQLDHPRKLGSGKITDEAFLALLQSHDPADLASRFSTSKDRIFERRRQSLRRYAQRRNLSVEDVMALVANDIFR